MITEVTTQCPKCKETVIVTLCLDAYTRYVNGELTANAAFPELSNIDYERIVTGRCPGCKE